MVSLLSASTVLFQMAFLGGELRLGNSFGKKVGFMGEEFNGGALN